MLAIAAAALTVAAVSALILFLDLNQLVHRLRVASCHVLKSVSPKQVFASIVGRFGRGVGLGSNSRVTLGQVLTSRSEHEAGKGGGLMQQLSGHVAIVDDDASTRAALARLLAIHKIDCRTYPRLAPS